MEHAAGRSGGIEDAMAEMFAVLRPDGTIIEESISTSKEGAVSGAFRGVGWKQTSDKYGYRTVPVEIRVKEDQPDD